MARINLLPWRAERRKSRQKEFAGMLGLSALAGILVAFLIVSLYNGRISSQNGRNSINSMMTLLQATYSWGGSGASLSVRRPGQRSRVGHTSSSQASARGQG